MSVGAMRSTSPSAGSSLPPPEGLRMTGTDQGRTTGIIGIIACTRLEAATHAKGVPRTYRPTTRRSRRRRITASPRHPPPSRCPRERGRQRWGPGSRTPPPRSPPRRIGRRRDGPAPPLSLPPPPPAQLLRTVGATPCGRSLVATRRRSPRTDMTSGGVPQPARSAAPASPPTRRASRSHRWRRWRRRALPLPPPPPRRPPRWPARPRGRRSSRSTRESSCLWIGCASPRRSSGSHSPSSPP
mmetsp:Transcript_41975/g.135413  ORF Transcript_41975/g.135413 Transcript_41975/m.135413 type:complete len:242 (+) Transcript_41975:798-1523(+)